jgi:hypothetical protein
MMTFGYTAGKTPHVRWSVEYRLNRGEAQSSRPLRFNSCGVVSKEGNRSGVDLGIPKAWYAGERASNGRRTCWMRSTVHPWRRLAGTAG